MTPHDKINAALDGDVSEVFALVDECLPYKLRRRDIASIIDLIDNALPGWMWRVQTCGLSSEAWVSPDLNDPRCAELDPQTWDNYYERNEVEIRPGSPQAAEVALCAAMLRAWVDAGGLK